MPSYNSSLPEHVVARKGLPEIPPDLAEDADVTTAYHHLKELFSRFNATLDQDASGSVLTKEKQQARANKTRRQIAPAAMLAIFYLYQRAFKASKNGNDLELRQFAAPLQVLLTKFQQNAPVKDLLLPFDTESVDGDVLRAPNKRPALTELKAALATNAVGFGYDFRPRVGTEELKNEVDTLKLALSHWTTVRIFLVWKSGCSETEFDIVPVDQVNVLLQSIEAKLLFHKQVVKVAV